MNIRDAKLLSFIGKLKFMILTDEQPPERDGLKYQNEGNIWYAEEEGWVDFFKEGDGGISRTIMTIDGEERSFTSVGATRCGVVNREGLGPCIKVKYTTDDSKFENGTGFDSYVTLDAAQQAAEITNTKLEKEVDERGEVTWVPKRPEQNE